MQYLDTSGGWDLTGLVRTLQHFLGLHMKNLDVAKYQPDWKRKLRNFCDDEQVQAMASLQDMRMHGAQRLESTMRPCERCRAKWCYSSATP